MKLKTTFWNSPELPQKTEKLSFIYGIMATANVVTGILTENTMLIIFNMFPVLLMIIITLSYNKHKKEAQTK